MRSSELDKATQYEAVLSRDKRCDGIFYFAKKDTRIYCRPSCPTPRKEDENYYFFDSIEMAKSYGLVACRYCHPTRLNNKLSLKILDSIDAGVIRDKGVCGLAHELNVSEQHLRRVVRSKTGTSPSRLNNELRLKTAKQLTLQTELPITEIAFSAGFTSIRQFNDTFKKTFEVSPREMRKAASVLPSIPPLRILGLKGENK